MYGVFRLSGSICLSLAMGVTAAAVAVLSLVSSAEEEPQQSKGKPLPIIMYHSVVPDGNETGEYVISRSQLEEDLLALKDMGYETVFCSQAEEYVDGGKLPERPVILSFDDGCYNNFSVVLPLLEKYDMKGTFAPVGEWCEAACDEQEPSEVWSYMKPENLRTLVQSGRCELASHSYSMHALDKRRGMLPMDGESFEEYRRILWGDLHEEEKLFSIVGAEDHHVIAYPYGFANEDTERLTAEMGYTVSLGCGEFTNRLVKGEPDCLKLMGRYNRTNVRSVKDILDECK